MQTDIQISRIRTASREIVRQVGLHRDRFPSIGSASQCHALVELDAHGEVNVGKLALMLSLDQSTISRLVVQMIRDGLCRVRQDEGDRRNKVISLTPKGAKLVSTIHAEANFQVREALGRMNDEEKKIVVQGLSIYAKALRRSSLLKEYKIRKLLAKDVPQLINLTRSVWEEFGFDSNHPDASFFEAELSKVHDVYSAERSSYFVLVRNKEIMGGVGFSPLVGAHENICELKGMYLSPLIRGLGLGSVLLQHTLQVVKREGFKECYLETMDHMHTANSLYQKAGFIRLDEPKGNTGHTWTNCWYIKEF